MLMYIFTAVGMMFFFIIYSIQNKNRNRIKTYPKFNKVNYYSYCNDFIKTKNKIKIENCIKKQFKLNHDKNIWLDKIIKLNYEFNLKNFKNKFKNVLIDINKKNHYCFCVLDNKFNEFKNKKLLIFDFGSVYNYDQDNFNSKEYLIYLSKYCHKNKIIFIIISELHPNKFNEDKFKFKFLNKNNIITPYNYKTKAFGSIIRLKENSYNSKPAEITINKIILDIFNRYGCTYSNTIYIGKTSIPKLHCIIV